MNHSDSNPNLPRINMFNNKRFNIYSTQPPPDATGRPDRLIFSPSLINRLPPPHEPLSSPRTLPKPSNPLIIPSSPSNQAHLSTPKRSTPTVKHWLPGLAAASPSERASKQPLSFSQPRRPLEDRLKLSLNMRKNTNGSTTARQKLHKDEEQQLIKKLQQFVDKKRSDRNEYNMSNATHDIQEFVDSTQLDKSKKIRRKGPQISKIIKFKNAVSRVIGS